MAIRIFILAWYGEKTLSEGIEQLSVYMNSRGEKEGWLVNFDRSPEKSWDNKIFWQEEKLFEVRVIRVMGS